MTSPTSRMRSARGAGRCSSGSSPTRSSPGSGTRRCSGSTRSPTAATWSSPRPRPTSPASCGPAGTTPSAWTCRSCSRPAAASSAARWSSATEALALQEPRPVLALGLGHRAAGVRGEVEQDHDDVGADRDRVVLHKLLPDGEGLRAQPGDDATHAQPLPRPVVELTEVVHLEPREDQAGPPRRPVAHRQTGVLQQAQGAGVIDVAEGVGVRPAQLDLVLVRRGHGRSAVSEDWRWPPWASSGSALTVRSSDSARITAAWTLGSRSPLAGSGWPSTACSSGSNWARVSTFSSVTLATASGDGSFIDGMSEPLLLGAQPESLGDVLDVLELPALRQPAQLPEDGVRRGRLLGLGDQRPAVGRPPLLAQGLGERRPALDVALVGAGGGGGLVRVGHGIALLRRGRGHCGEAVEASV